MKSSEVVCYIPIELKSRELDTKLYLALRLVKKGFSVVIGNKTKVQNRMLLETKPFIYFDKGISKRYFNLYKVIKASNGQLVEIQEEGNISKDISNLINVHNNSCAELFSLIFTWGSAQKKIIKNNCPNLDYSILKDTGHPSFDLLNKDLVDYYRRLSKTNNKIEQGYILINTNFGIYNGQVTFEESKQLNENIKELYSQKKREEWKKVGKLQEKVFKEFLNMIKILSKFFPRKKIVVRPHPVEKIEIYKKELDGYKNVRIIREGSVREWIVNAECIIHYDCTSGLESFLAGKNVISFCPFYEKDLVATLPIEMSVKIKNVDDLIKYINNNYIDGNLSSSEIKKKKFLIIENSIANIYKNATDEIILNLEELCNSWQNTKVMFFKRRYYLINFNFINLIKRIKNKIKLLTINKKNIKSLANSKFPYLNFSEVEQRLDIWYGIFSIEKKFKLKELEKETFLISN